MQTWGQRCEPRRRWQLTAAQKLLAGSIAIIAVLFLGVDPAAADRYEDLDVSAKVTYEVDPAAGEVHVTAELSVTADKPPVAISGGERIFFFTGYGMLTRAGIEDLRATQNGRELTIEVEQPSPENFLLDGEAPDPGEMERIIERWQLVSLNFAAPLHYRRTAEVIVTYTIPSPPLRSEVRVERFTPAYIALDVLDPTQAEQVEFVVALPREFGTDEGPGPTMMRRVQADRVEFFAEVSAEAIETWSKRLSLQNREEYQVTTIKVDGIDVEVRSWPNDDEWTDFVVHHVDDGLDDLVALVGLPWPEGRELEIVQTQNPSLSGYGGTFSQYDRRIEVPDYLDGPTLFHELSHVWFHGNLFDGLWISEGLSELYAWEMWEQRGGPDAESFEPASLSSRHAFSLNRWHQGLVSDDEEVWAYQASATVMRQFAEEIGFDGFRDVVAMAANDRSAYHSSHPGLRSSSPNHNWRYLLDLLEQVGGADGEAADQTFQRYVLGSGFAGSFGDRREALDRYGALVEAGGEAPLGVREAMAGWRFARAEDRMGEAEKVLAQRQRIEDQIDPWGLEIHHGYQMLYRSADDDFTRIEAELTELEDAAQQVVDVHETVDRERTWLEQLGLWRYDQERALAGVHRSFETNHLFALETRVEAVGDRFSESSGKGINRLVGALSTVAAVMVAFVQVRVHRRVRPLA